MGAGVAGLDTAVALHRLGMDATVLEQGACAQITVKPVQGSLYPKSS